ncbi:MAG: hypothetical protein KCHDKBKB_02996 [Elusimicrobia bacterium]|nr:hypothetical protein [Elusimicrobiota bacterium]
MTAYSFAYELAMLDAAIIARYKMDEIPIFILMERVKIANLTSQFLAHDGRSRRFNGGQTKRNLAARIRADSKWLLKRIESVDKYKNAFRALEKEKK